MHSAECCSLGMLMELVKNWRCNLCVPTCYPRELHLWPLRPRITPTRRQRRYSDHFVTVCVWVGGCVYVSTIKRKSDCSDLKLGVVVVFETMSKRIDFGFKMSRVWVRGQHFELLSPATTYRIKLITFFYNYENYVDNIKLQYMP